MIKHECCKVQIIKSEDNKFELCLSNKKVRYRMEIDINEDETMGIGIKEYFRKFLKERIAIN